MTVITTPAAAVESYPEIDKRIRHTFNVLGRVAKGVVEGHIRSAVVSGAPGVGKSYTLENVLRNAQEQGNIKFAELRGVISPIGVYQRLYEVSEAGGVILLDDIDAVFAEIDSVNILKAALDTSKKRVIHWAKESRVLEEAGVPRDFEFNGAAIFVSNINFCREIDRGNKMSPHYKALLDRSLYVDMGIHTKREILVRIGQVALSQKFLDENGLSKKQATEMLAWVSANLDQIRTLSIRTIIHLASLVKTDGNWREMSETLMLKARTYTRETMQ